MKGFPLQVELRVRFRDADALGHANNAAYLTLLEEARFSVFRDHLGMTDVSKLDVILARVEIDYRSPAMPGESLVIGLGVSKIGGASFELAYRIEEKASGRLIAEAKSVQVGYDFAASKVRPWSDARRASLQALHLARD